MSRRNATPKLVTPPPEMIRGREALIALPGISATDLDLVDEALSQSVRDAPARRVVRSRKSRRAPGATAPRMRARRPGGDATGSD